MSELKNNTKLPTTWEEYVNQQSTTIGWNDMQHILYELIPVNGDNPGWQLTKITHGNLDTVNKTLLRLSVRDMADLVNAYAVQLLNADGRISQRISRQFDGNVRVNFPTALYTPWTDEWLSWLLLPEVSTYLHRHSFALAALNCLASAESLETFIDCGPSAVVVAPLEAEGIKYRYIYSYHPNVDSGVLIVYSCRKFGNQWVVMQEEVMPAPKGVAHLHDLQCTGWVNPPFCINKYLYTSNKCLSAIGRLADFITDATDETRYF